MKKNFKLLLAITITFSALSFSQKTLAEEFIEGTYCPVSPDPGLSSICGTVLSSLPEDKTLSDGTVIKEPGKGVEGALVYLYECNNAQPSCKDNGDIIHPFASTQTNEDGRFHVLTRKLDNPVTLQATQTITVNGASVQSKRRYLIFLCADKYLGIQVIPSYMDLTNILQEVSCPGATVYKTPPNKFQIPTPRLANQTGYGNEKEELLEELNYPGGLKPGNEDYVPHLTAQVYWDKFQPNQSMNLEIKLKRADPRFLEPSESDGIAKINDAAPGNDIELNESGAWWSLDCFEKYKEDSYMLKFCMGNKIATGTNAEGAMTSYKISNNREEQIKEYERRLYEEFDFLRQQKLPNIPPYDDILFYKEFPARQDITDFKQDITSVASFNATQFSNCIGDVFLRREKEDSPSLFPNCEIFKMCNEVVNNENYLNRYTQGGPASGLSNIFNIMEQYNNNLDLRTPLCKRDPTNIDENPVRVGDVQPPWVTGSGGYTLDSSYWNNEFVYYYANNETGKYGFRFNCQAGECSYPEGISTESVNKYPFTLLTESGLGGQWAYNAGESNMAINDAKTPNNGIYTAAIMSGTYTPNNWISSPYKNATTERGIVTGKANVNVGSGRTVNLNKWSEVNTPYFLEIVDIDAAADATHYRNDMEPAPENHYPFPDFGVWGTIAVALQTFINLGGAATLQQTTYFATLTGREIIGNNVYDANNGGWVSTYGDFVKNNNSSIIIASNAPEDKPDDRKMRPPVSAIRMTSAAIRRHFALGKDETTAKEYAAHDIYDSMLSTLYGEGNLDFGEQHIQEKMSQVIGYFKLGLIKDSILSFFGVKTGLNNKSFLDRLNEDNLGSPGSVDSLKTEFPLSESTFLEEFPLPTPMMVPGTDNNKVINLEKNIIGAWLFQEDWGGKNARAKDCYPWTERGLGTEQRCGTFNEETPSLVSRTCRVDECWRTTTEAVCTCNRRDVGDRLDYFVTCPSSEGPRVNLATESNKCDEKNAYDLELRRIVAEKQTTCRFREDIDLAGLPVVKSTDRLKAEMDCVKEAYQGEIKGKYREMEENNGGKYCGPKYFYNEPDWVTKAETVGDVNAPWGTPQGIVSIAGPFLCAGIIDRMGELKVESEVLNDVQKAAPLDPVKVADNQLTQSFQAPSCDKIIYNPAAFISADTSIRNVFEINIARNKDTTGLGGYGALTRKAFSIPKKDDSELNPTYYHCIGNVLGGSGAWTCPIRETPNPEEVNIYDLQASDKSCNLNPSVECDELVFGIDYQGEGERMEPRCQTYTPKSFDSSYYNFSEEFVSIVNGAANRFNVPASVLLAYMQGVGNLQKYNYYWSKFGGHDLYNASSFWYGGMDGCDDMNTAAQGPYDWILVWFHFALQMTEARDALNEISSGRGETASRCNFLDATYTAAANLSLGEGSSCGSWSWGTAQGKLMDMTFGSHRVGDYADAPTYNAGTASEAVFEACRYK